MFLQYMFFCQWMKVKKAANENGIRIMGDVPFYVGVDSVDVWGGKDNFLLDTDGRSHLHSKAFRRTISARQDRDGAIPSTTGTT